MNMVLRAGPVPALFGQIAWVQDIERAPGRSAFRAGAQYAAQKRVSNVVYAPDGSSIQARTRGSRPRPYEQHIRLVPRAEGGFNITGRCSCPVGLNCKHIAAVLVSVDPARLEEMAAPAPQRLGDHFEGWLKQLERASEPDREDYPDSVNDRLFYLMTESKAQSGTLLIDPRSVRLNKNGKLGDDRSFVADRIFQTNPPKFLRPSDRWILRRLSSKNHNDGVDERAELLGRIRPILMALIELHSSGLTNDAGRIGFTRLDAASLAELEAAVPEVVWQGAEALRALGAKLREAGGSIPRSVLPGAFVGTLRPYQQQGVDWLQFLRDACLGGVLADDMGLGKTVQTLAHVAIEKAEGRLDRPVLIVCPTSLVPNWMAEAARFTPNLRTLALHGPGRQKLFEYIATHDVVISTYPLLTRDAPVLTAQEWHVVVLDEAQTIKNPEAVTTKLAAGLTARQRLCLSGTPLQNHLGELWSLFDFLAPGFLGSRKTFRARWQLPIEKNGDDVRRRTLARRLRPFLLRRTKEAVASDLPPKTDIMEQVEMEAGQRAIYDSVRMAMHSKVRQAIAARGLTRSGIIVLDALLKMRQACCDPRLLKLASVKTAKAGSAKLDRLMEMLPMLLEDGRRILLFSQFTSMLDLIKLRLDTARIRFVELQGDTKDRATPIAQFQSGAVDLFLISLKAGGTGLNLTAADTVIHYDPWWNPAVEDQATDRAHRIGQDRPVFVHRLVTMGTIEEKMETLKHRKRALVHGILNAEDGGLLGLSESEIEALFT